MDKMGGMGGVMGMLPGIGKMKAQIEQAGLDDGMIKRQRAIIDSMTPKERRNPDLLKASRKKRIAAGSGTRVEEVNKLLKMHRQMADMMKKMGGGKGGGIGAALGNMIGPRRTGGMPQPTPEMLADDAEEDGRRSCRNARRPAAACRPCRRASAARARPCRALGRRQAAGAARARPARSAARRSDHSAPARKKK